MGINELIGKTLIDITGMEKDSESIIFTTSTGQKYLMDHLQECCEDVRIDDVCGDVKDLLNSPILMAEETTNRGNDRGDSYTWTFYHLATIKGYVDLKWLGRSNGYYSEAVSFYKLESENEN